MHPSSAVLLRPRHIPVLRSKPIHPSTPPTQAAQSAGQRGASAPLPHRLSRCLAVSACRVPARGFRARALRSPGRPAVGGCWHPVSGRRLSHRTAASPLPWSKLLCAPRRSATAAPATTPAALQIRAHPVDGSAECALRTSSDRAPAGAAGGRILPPAFPETSMLWPGSLAAILPQNRHTRAHPLLQAQSPGPALRVL